MAFTTKDDINILQPSDTQTVGAGAGNDRYILDGSVIGPGQSVTISDALGVNTLQLTGGLQIASSQVANDAVLLTLNNGARVSLLGASSFQYQTGGNAFTGAGGTTQDFPGFVVGTLGAPAVPAAGAAPVSGASNVTIDDQGGTSGGGGGGGGGGDGDGGGDGGAGGDPGDGQPGGGSGGPPGDDGDGTVDPGAGGDPGTGSGGPVDGAALILTAGDDNLVGTAQDDVFDGITNATGGATTLGAGDSLIGGGGFDVLRLSQDISQSDLRGTFGIERIETVAQSITLGADAVASGLKELVNNNTAASLLTLTGVFDSLNASSSAGTLDTVVLGYDAASYKTTTPVVALNALDFSAVGNAASDALSVSIPLTAQNFALSLTDEGQLLGAVDQTVTFAVTLPGEATPTQFSQIVLGTAGADTVDASGQTLSGQFANFVDKGVLVLAGNGNDVITGSKFSNYLDGGAGDDQVTLNAVNTTGKQTVLGGSGTDTLNVTKTLDVPANPLLSIKDFEVLNLSEAVSLTLDASFLANNPVSAVTGVAGGAVEQLTVNGKNLVNDVINLAGVTVTNAKVTLNGLSGDDTLTGTSAADSLIGGAGNDLLVGGGGADVINGDAGNDTLTLDGSKLNNGAQYDGGAGNDTLQVLGAVDLTAPGAALVKSFEALDLGSGASLKIDVATLDVANTNKLTTVTGTLGSETLTLLGTPQVDTVDVSGITTVTKASLVIDVGAGNDTVTGSAGKDIITGGLGNDTLIGGGGDDVLTGGSGVDTVNGGAGDDTIIISRINDSGAERLDGGDGTDTLHTQDDVDLRAAAQLTNFEVLSLAEGADLQVTVAALTDNAGLFRVLGTAGGKIETVTFVGDGKNGLTMADDTIDLSPISEVENARLVALGLAGNDTITGSNFADRLDGGEGNDTMDGGVGNDILIGGAGDDTVNGGEGDDLFLVAAGLDFTMADIINSGFGDDLIRFTSLTANDTLMLNANVTDPDNTLRIEISDEMGDASGTKALNVDASAVVLSGGVTITGNAGDNTLTGTGFADSLIGGLGNDTLSGGAGADSLDGGDGNDMLMGDAGNDTLMGRAGDDLLEGGTGDDMLMGEDGNDSLIGGAGDDTVMGGPGNDLFLIATGADFTPNDVVDGGTGNDLIRFTSTTNGDTLTLNNKLQDADGELRIEISDAMGNATGTTALNVNAGAVRLLDDGPIDITLVGNAGQNVLRGGDGDDTLIGGAGNDTLVGGAGNDMLFGDSGRNTLVGGAGDDFITAGTGGDTIAGGAGKDDIELGAGSDLVSVDGITSDDDRSDAFGFMQNDRVALTNITNTMGSGRPVQFASVADVTSNGFNFTNKIIADTSANLGQFFNDDEELSFNLVPALRIDLSAQFPNGLYIYITDDARLYFTADGDLSDTENPDIFRVGGFFEDTKDVFDAVGPNDSDRAVLTASNFVFGAPTDLFGL